MCGFLSSCCARSQPPLKPITEITENQTADCSPVRHPAELQIFWLALLLGRPSGWGFILVLKTVGAISHLVCAP